MKSSNPLILSTSPLSQPAKKPRKNTSFARRQRLLYGRKRRNHTGKERDKETGLYYYGARYLDSKTSRWLSGDPAMGEYIPEAPVDDEARKHNGNLPGMGGVFNYVNLHVYHYAGNNPVKYTDPDGREDDEPPSTFKLPEGFFNQFTRDTMKQYWAKGEVGVDTTENITTFCSSFLPYLVGKLGDDVYNDIFPNGELSATALGQSFTLNLNLEQIAAGKKPDVKANAAQELANAGYLVFAAINGGSHVAVVGPQSLSYSSYPDTPWKGDKRAFQQGNGFGGDGVLWQYPVFVQAGSYTGVVNPGNAMGRGPFRVNTVNYFIYKPRR
jgi:RHS repeat-associated protein